MHTNANGSNIVHRISFTPAEDAVLQGLAENAGMSVPAFVRARALYGNVQSIDWDSLKEHTEAINVVAEEIRWYTSNQNPNRWLFEADLLMIQECLEKLIDLERRFIDEIYRDTQSE